MSTEPATNILPIDPGLVLNGEGDLNHLIRTQTRTYLSNIDPDNPPPPEHIESGVLRAVNNAISALNVSLEKGSKIPLLKGLNHAQIADIVMTLHPIARVIISENEDDYNANLLAIYESEGPYAGLYRFDKPSLTAIIRQYKYTIKTTEIDEVINILEEQAPKKHRTLNRDLIAVENGIFDYRTKTLQPFSQDYVFLSKAQVPYNPAATNPTFVHESDGLSWDLDSWVESLSDDPEIVNSLWEIMSATLRPNVSWDKAAWLFSTRGANGKGTFVTLLRNLVGKKAYASIPIVNFGKPFALEPLLNATAVIVDENDVGTYIDKAAKLKAVITNDVIDVDRKHKKDVAFQFRGFMVQCLNEFPKVNDRTNSFNRRQLFIPMNKAFEGIERKYIKDDYLHRPEVLEYALKKVLHTDFYRLSTPKASLVVLEEFKTVSDPLYDFATSVFPDLAWDAVPLQYLYELYKAWYAENISSKTEVGTRLRFKRNILSVLESAKIPWTFNPEQLRVTLDRPEPLSNTYKLENWMRDSSSTDVNKRTNPNTTERYTGVFVRNTPAEPERISE